MNFLSNMWFVGRSRVFWCGLLLLASVPSAVCAQTRIDENFENYRSGVLTKPWQVSNSQGSAGGGDGAIAVVKEISSLGGQALEISGLGYDATYKGSFQPNDVTLKLDISLPSGLATGDVAGGVAYGGITLFFVLERDGAYRVASEGAPKASITGFVPGKWHTLLLHVDRDHNLGQLESGPRTSEVFTFQPAKNGGQSGDIALLGGKGMHVDALTLEAVDRDFLIDSDGDGMKDYADPDDDNDGLEDGRDNYPLDGHLLFFEDWEKGLSGAIWKTLGRSAVKVVQGAGRQGGGAFDSAGTAQSPGGVISEASFSLAARPELSFWMRGESSKTYWQNVKVGWASLSGAEGNILQSLVSFGANPENSSSSFQYCVGNECFTEPWLDKDHQNTWLFCKISINRNGTVSFYRDGQTLWTSRQALDFNYLPYQVIEISGQSYQASQLIDDVTVTLPDAESFGRRQLSGWRRWEGLSGAVDKALVLARSSQAQQTVNSQDEKTLAGFYSRGQSWPEGQLEFDFRFLDRAAKHAPAFFYSGTYRGQSAKIKVQLSDGELQVSRWTGEQFVGFASLVYDFKTDETYRCEIEVEQEKVRVFQNGTLKASSIGLPTHLEAQRLSGNDHLLLVWMPPQNDAFSHLRIYRSTEPKVRGSLLADNVTGLTFVDKFVTRGTTYLYRFHTVDATGNESRKSVDLTVFRHGITPPLPAFLRIA